MRCAALLVVIGSIAVVSCGDGDTSDTPHSTPVTQTTTATPSSTVRPTAGSELTSTDESAVPAEPRAVEAIVDRLFAAFAEADSETATALFTADGVWVDKNRDEWVGTSRIAAYVDTVGPGISRCERTGPAEIAAGDSYAFPVEFTWRGVDYRDVAVLTMVDDLILRLDWLPQP